MVSIPLEDGDIETSRSLGRGTDENQTPRSTLRVFAILLVGALLVPIVWGWIPTPDFYRNRGVVWDVFAESPMHLDALQGVMTVFSFEVQDVFHIPTAGIQLQSVPDDGISNYTSWHSGTGSAALWGPIHVPVYFLTGTAWQAEGLSSVLGRAAPNAAGGSMVPWWGGGLNPGVEVYVTVVACCSPILIHLLLHEFGHNLGFKDLYQNNLAGIRGCEELPVIMANGAYLNATILSPSGPPLSHNVDWNTSVNPARLDIINAYLNRSNDTMIWQWHWMTTNATGALTEGWDNLSFDMTVWRWSWTREELQLLGLPASSQYSCPQEGLPSRALQTVAGGIVSGILPVGLVLKRKKWYPVMRQWWQKR